MYEGSGILFAIKNNVFSFNSNSGKNIKIFNNSSNITLFCQSVKRSKYNLVESSLMSAPEKTGSPENDF